MFALGILAWLASVPLGAAEAVASPACVRMEVAAKSGFSLPKSWQGRSRLVAAESQEDLSEKKIVAGRSVVLCAESGLAVEAVVEVPGFWIRREFLTLGSPGTLRAVPLSAWPLGSITGTLGKADDRPAVVRISTLPARGTRRGAEPPPGQLECPVDPKGRFACDLPAATYDLHVVPAPFVPIYLAGVRVEPAGRRDLGAIPMRRGASIAGWVAVEGARFEPAKTRVRLRPASISGAPPDPRREAQIEAATIEVPVRGDGFFQWVGVPAGSWDVEAEQPPLAPARSAGLRVEPEAETVLRDPLILRPKEALALRIDPPLDWSGRRWQVAVQGWAEGTDRPAPAQAFAGAADEEGVVRIASEPPGQFLVSVKDARGQTFFSDRHFQLDVGDESRVEIRWVDVAGRLKLGDEPLAARLWFGPGGKGVTGEPVESDRDGKFDVVLPNEGSWPVEIDSAGGVRAQVEAQVEADRDRRARLDLRLPDTRLFGHVTFDGGKPAPGALVFLSAEEGGSGDFLATADSDGSYSFRGLPVGRMAISAEHRDSEGAWSVPTGVVALSDGQETGPIDLALRRKAKISGRVLSPSGPVARAVITAWPFAGASGSLARAGSDLDGTFTIEAPPGSGPLVLVPRATGYGLRAFVRTVGTEPLALELSAEAGTLEVATPWLADGASASYTLAFFEDGIAVPYGNLLARWAMAQGVEARPSGPEGTSVRVPGLAPGRWDVCAIPSRALSFTFASGGEVPRTACAGGTLSNGEILRLEVPKPAALSR